jgi:predicted secreted Zn-dependent protease
MGEQIGPVNPTTYSVTGKTLAEVVDNIGIEAADTKFAASHPKFGLKDGKIVNASVVVKITMKMPVWNPPSTVGPKTRAEWQRAMKVLRAHEDAHVKSIQARWKGLSAKLNGQSPDDAEALFQETVTKCQADQDAMDPFTVDVDLSIEDDEIEEMEEKKKKGK